MTIHAIPPRERARAFARERVFGAAARGFELGGRLRAGSGFGRAFGRGRRAGAVAARALANLHRHPQPGRRGTRVAGDLGR